MAKSIAELEQSIKTSAFFTITGENMEAVRSKAKAKLVLDLWEYSQHYWLKDDYGAEIYDTILRCMERFNPETAIFTDYFKNQVKFAIQNSKKAEYKIQQNEISDSYFYKDGDDSELSIFELEKYAKNDINEMIEKQDAVSRITFCLEVIEKVFKTKQERTQPRLRKLWTLDCFDALKNIENLDKNYTWIDYEFLEKHRFSEKLPTQKEVAAMLGKCEQDASRDIKQFRKLIESFKKIKQ